MWPCVFVADLAVPLCVWGQLRHIATVIVPRTICTVGNLRSSPHPQRGCPLRGAGLDLGITVVAVTMGLSGHHLQVSSTFLCVCVQKRVLASYRLVVSLQSCPPHCLSVCHRGSFVAHLCVPLIPALGPSLCPSWLLGLSASVSLPHHPSPLGWGLTSCFDFSKLRWPPREPPQASHRPQPLHPSPRPPHSHLPLTQSAQVE